MTVNVALPDAVASALLLALEQASHSPDGGHVPDPVIILPPADPVVDPPVLPHPSLAIDNQVLVDYVFGSRPDLARSYTQVRNFSLLHPELQDPSVVCAEYEKTVANAVQPASAENTRYNAGTGFPIERIAYPSDAFFISAMGRRIGHPLWYSVLDGLHSDIGALIQRTEGGNDTRAAMEYDPDTYPADAPLRAFVH